MRRQLGHTLLEVMIATSLVTGIVLVASQTSQSITDASTYGRHKLSVQSDNQKTLFFIANDLQNSSSDSDPITNEPRFQILDGEVVSELLTRTAESVAKGESAEYVDGVSTKKNEATANFTGTKTGVSNIGVTPREANDKGEVLEGRPRLMKIEKNSRFTFRKVTGYTVDVGLGEATPIWSTPITYFVRKRHLIRRQDGAERVIGRNVSAFKVFAQDKGNFVVFLRTQTRDRTTGEVLSQSGSIEVNPKNK